MTSKIHFFVEGGRPKRWFSAGGEIGTFLNMMVLFGRDENVSKRSTSSTVDHWRFRRPDWGFWPVDVLVDSLRCRRPSTSILLTFSSRPSNYELQIKNWSPFLDYFVMKIECKWKKLKVTQTQMDKFGHDILIQLEFQNKSLVFLKVIQKYMWC